MTFVQRVGPDTLGALEAAAPLRRKEAHKLLAQGERLGALYLFGYSVELRLKVAFYRRKGLIPSTVIDSRLHRRPAEDQIKTMPGFPPNRPAGHHVAGWAWLLDQTPKLPGTTQLTPTFRAEILRRAGDVSESWVEYLRYRARQPYDREVRKVAEAAAWFARHGRSLWS